MSDDFDDRQFQKVVTEGLVPKLEGSKYAVSIVPGVDRIDAKFCVELGAMIMMDKPILAIVDPKVWQSVDDVPNKLKRVADMIVIADVTTDEGRERIAQSIKDFIREQDSRTGTT